MIIITIIIVMFSFYKNEKKLFFACCLFSDIWETTGDERWERLRFSRPTVNNARKNTPTFVSFQIKFYVLRHRRTLKLRLLAVCDYTDPELRMWMDVER